MLDFLITGLRAGLRGRSIQGIFILGILLIGVAYLSGYFSPRQPQTVALDVGLSLLRLVLVFLILFWIQELVMREIERRTIMFSLAYPVARSAYLLGRYLAVLVLACLACLVLGLLLWLAVMLTGAGYEQSFPVHLGLPYILTLLAILVDAAVVGAFALCIAAIATVPMLPLLAGFLFAVLGRAIGAVVDYLSRGADGDTDLVQRFQPIVHTIQWVLPDLSRLDWRTWTLYGMPLDGESLLWSLLMAASYLTIMLCLAIWGFSRREFF